MNLFKPVSSIMTKNLITMRPTESIATAANIFSDNKIHHIPIVECGNLVGIVSLSDFLFFQRGFLDTKEDKDLEKIRMQNYTIDYIMTSGLAKLNPTDKVVVALDIFSMNILHAIPVVENDALVGLVTTHDIISKLALDNLATATYEH